MAYRQFDNRKSKSKLTDLVQNPDKLSSRDKQTYLARINSDNFAWGTDSPTHLELEGKKYTLGFEIETIEGEIPLAESANLNVAAVHDGSLRGPNGEDPTGGEYVTGVMYGDKGFLHLNKICTVLNKYCDIDKRCGVHVHIGSLNWKEEDIVFCYLLANMIEKEAFDILPKSRRKNSYCRPLEDFRGYLKTMRQYKDDKLQFRATVEEAFNAIFRYVSGGVEQSSKCNQTTNHPKGSKCGYSKSSQRYCWMNFVTLIFNTKGNLDAKTLEIRSHGATMNYNKIKNWTKIWVAFVEFVNNNKSDILRGHVVKNGNSYPISLETMVMLAYPKGGEKLVKFIRKRKESFATKGEEIDYDKITDFSDLKMTEILRK